MGLAWALPMSVEALNETESGEPRLIAASLADDPDAFAELVRLHQRRVFRLAGRFFLRPEDVEEVAQETFLTAWQRLDTYKARAPFEHWLTRLCLNCCYARLRKDRRVEQPVDALPPTAAPNADPDAKLEVAALLQRLEPQDRFILLLMDGEGWSAAEIAERLGWTRTNVKVRAHRARKRLREALERESAR